MKTLNEIFNIIEANEVSIYEYKENGKLCGYELNTYTSRGVNEILFLDFRNTKLEPEDANDFLNVFSQRIESIDIDEEIELNRQDKRYREAFTFRESVEDFEEWKKSLEGILNEIKGTEQQAKHA